MEETTLGRGEGGRYQCTGGKRKKNKLIKKIEEVSNLVLGVYLQIDKDMEAFELTLAGREKWKKYTANYIQEWTTNNWQDVSDNFVLVSTLAKGWFMIKITKKEALDWALGRN